ncbi:PGF-CTERM sorting domain-containing protein [Halorussus marinus]|uniref:PGF-CTERM sorting domain-containing protein n=1 Tax=Halorussus marinus TaxID=2505976 RepID=UPI00106ECDEB|nr:PGF-CTERM sorting domain-containing protein [Halorussus marinus]
MIGARRLATLVAVVGLVAIAGAGASGAGTAQDANATIQTDYFAISYEDGNRDDAEAVAEYADAYYEVLFQRFGVEPVDEKVPVRVVDDVDCELGDAEGCYKSGIKATIYVTDDDRSVFYHELAHRFQAKSMEGATWINPPGALDKHEVFVEGTARYLGASPEEIAERASFRAEDVPMTTKKATFDEYDDLALFAEFVLHEYGREGFDVLYTASDPREVASLSDGDYPELIEEFYDQLPEQQSRMEDGGAPLVGFTYDPFLPEPGQEVTFDARTPAAIEELGRSWYDGEADSYEWDFDGDGQIEATGPTVTRTVDDPANATVTLYVTVDGERRRAEQDLLDASMGLDRTARESVFDVSDVERGAGLTYPADRDADHRAFAGATVSLNLTVHNRGIAGTETVDVRFADRQVSSQRLALDAGETRQISLDHAIPADLEPGAYDYEIAFGNRTQTQTVYVREPEVSLEVDSVSVPNGTEGWIENELVKPGKRVSVRAEISAGGENLNLTRTVALRVDDRTVASRTVTVGSGTSGVRFNFTAPSELGTYRVRSTTPSNDSAVTITGYAPRLKVKEEIGVAEIEIESKAGACSATVTSVSISRVYSAESGSVEYENVSAINPGDDVTWIINLMPAEECGGVFHLPLNVSGETKSVPGSVRGPMEVYVDPTFSLEEPGEHEVRSGDTVLDTVNVTAESASTETTRSDESDSDDGVESDETDAERDGATPDQSTGTPGFGVVAAVVALVAAAALGSRRER